MQSSSSLIRLVRAQPFTVGSITVALLAAGFVLGATGQVAAAPEPGLRTFEQGKPIVADDFNVNFGLIEARLEALEARADLDSTYSTGAIYRGATASTFTGALGGYEGAKQACETALGSPTAHMCTAEELVRTHATGNPVGNGVDAMWHATGSRAMWPPNAPIAVSDCQSFTEPSNQAQGASISVQGALMQVTTCDSSMKIACCD